MIRISTRFAAVLVGTLLVWAGFSFQSPLAQQAPAGGTLALTGARVIDGTGAAPIQGATIVIADGRIQAVGPAASVAIPAGATRVDLAGKTVVPGLINAHGHLQADMSKRPARDRLAGQLRMYADYGITTVQVLGIPLDDVGEAVKLRDESLPGKSAPDRARVLVAAASLRNLKTAAEARDWANKYADMKVDIIKMHITGGPMDMTPEVCTTGATGATSSHHLGQHRHAALAVVELAPAVVRHVDRLDAVLDGDLGVFGGGDALQDEGNLELVLEPLDVGPGEARLEVVCGPRRAVAL